MIDYVVDASVAVKWVVDEPGTQQALLIREHRLYAPDLLMVECANVVWRKVRRNELEGDEAVLLIGALAQADIELVSSRLLMEPAARLAVKIDHPVYDCMYLALAESMGIGLVTADRGLCRKARTARVKCQVIELAELAP